MLGTPKAVLESPHPALTIELINERVVIVRQLPLPPGDVSPNLYYLARRHRCSPRDCHADPPSAYRDVLLIHRAGRSKPTSCV